MLGDQNHPIMQAWSNGPLQGGVPTPGAFIGDSGKPHSRVTVEPGFWLNLTQGPIGSFPPNKLPVRWFQHLNAPAPNMSLEVEIPNLKSVEVTRSLDQDAASCTIVMYDQSMNPLTFPGFSDVGPGATPSGQITRWLGEPGSYSPTYMQSAAALARWGTPTTGWSQILTPNALLRTYQGYGGYTNGVPNVIPTAVAAGNLVLSGTWLVDEVDVSTDGTITLKCRDMAKLLIDQMVYPPLIPSGLYPLHFQAFFYPSFNNPVPYGPAANNTKWITKAIDTPDGNGYWLAGSDGGVFSFGDAQFYGSLGGTVSGTATFPTGTIDYIISDIVRTKGGAGYYLVSDAGFVTGFGDANFDIGDVSELPITLDNPITAAASQPGHDGYWMLSTVGGVFSFGSALYYGSGPQKGSIQYVDIEPTPSGNGYWLLSADGDIYTFGDARYYGGAASVLGESSATALAATPSGNGYYIVSALGGVFCFGDAQFYGSIPLDELAGDFTQLNALITDVVATQAGYRLIGLDGGVFDFGDAGFYGSLAGPFQLTLPGNMDFANPALDPTQYNPDYAAVIRDILCWSGFTAYPYSLDTKGYPMVNGLIEPTGAYPVNSILGGLDPAGQISDDIFNKMPPINSITTIKEIVGYIFKVNEDGSVFFAAPNIYAPGNFLSTGTQTTYVPVVDEAMQLTQYVMAMNDQDIRSEIIIGSFEPLANAPGTIVSSYVPRHNLQYLRGMVKPAEWIDQFFIDEAQQILMAELLALMIWQKLRQGSVSCSANPLLQPDDQIRIFERQSGETYIHHVQSIHTMHDLDSGSYSMDITTNWLGDENTWSINSPKEFTLWTLSVVPNVAGEAIAAPSSPSVVVTGTPGSTTVYYALTALTENGETTLGPATEITTSRNPLTVSNFNAVSWTPVDGATSYKLYKSEDGKIFFLFTTTTDTFVNDTGGAVTGDQPPSENTATSLTAPGPHTITCFNNNLLTGSPTISGTGFSIQVGSVLVVDSALNREVVTVTEVNSGAGQFTANFSQPHQGIYSVIGVMDDTNPQDFLP